MFRDKFIDWVKGHLAAYDRFQFERAFRRARLSRGESATLSALQFFANKQGMCAPSVETLANHARYSRRSVCLFLKRLLRSGWIAIRRSASVWHTNLYVLTAPPESPQSAISSASQAQPKDIPCAGTADKQKETKKSGAHETLEADCSRVVDCLPVESARRVRKKLPVILATARRHGKPPRTTLRAIQEACNRILVDEAMPFNRVMNIIYKYVIHARVLEYDNIYLNPKKLEANSIRENRIVAIPRDETVFNLKRLMSAINRV